MKDTRARFEEIWPVPDGVEFCDVFGGYWHESTQDKLSVRFREYDIRLDTFTRCQETTDVYVSLVDELVQELELSAEWVEKKKQGDRIDSLIDRAKQIMEQNK